MYATVSVSKYKKNTVNKHTSVCLSSATATRVPTDRQTDRQTLPHAVLTVRSHIYLYSDFDRAMAQTVSRQPPRPAHVGFVVDKVTL